MATQVEPALLGSHFLNGNPLQPNHSPSTIKELQLEAKESPSTTLHQKAWKPPPSAWKPQCHPRAAEVARIVDDYYLKHWPFPGEESKQRFSNAGFSRVTCLYFPTAKDDRIEYACRLLTVLFLIDGEQSGIFFFLESHSRLKILQGVVESYALTKIVLKDELESMSLEEGKAFNDNLMPIMRGTVEPDRERNLSISASEMLFQTLLTFCPVRLCQRPVHHVRSMALHARLRRGARNSSPRTNFHLHARANRQSSTEHERVQSIFRVQGEGCGKRVREFFPRHLSTVIFFIAFISFPFEDASF